MSEAPVSEETIGRLRANAARAGINLTDEDSRIMPVAGGGFDQCYNAQAVVATETGMLYPLQMAAPDVRFIPANPEASCMYMKMITLPKLRDSLRHMRHEVRVGKEIATRARVPIDRMVAIG